MRVVSWNVNGVRAAWGKGLRAFLDNTDAEVVALQEVRARRAQLPADLVGGTWSLAVHAGDRPGYSGVATLSRRAPEAIQEGLGIDTFDAEGRLLATRHGRLLVVNGYFPNGNGRERDNSRIPYKLDFYRTLFDQLEPARSAGEPILVVGDFNTAHREIDLARPKANRETSGFTDIERAELGRWLDSGWTDTFRVFEPGAGHYTWWSQRFGVRERNIGWRIDYALVSPAVLPYLKAAAIHPEVVGSDHCPISVVLDPAVRDPVLA